jgi:hypothetical protein
VARIIATEIAPTLPKAHRAVLMGSWPTIDEQVNYLTVRLYRKR